jgi:hypothetical protein
MKLIDTVERELKRFEQRRIASSDIPAAVANCPHLLTYLIDYIQLEELISHRKKMN